MWEKKGLIYSCDFYGTGSAVTPFVDIINDKVWRIYYTARTKDIISVPHFIEVEAGNPANILRAPKEQLFSIGRRGTFDSNGISMTSIVTVGDVKYIYYCGWTKQVSVPYALGIGLAIGRGDDFEKMYEGPVMDRSIHDPICVSAPCVIYDNERHVFRMWYISFTEWRECDGRLEPIYVIKTAYSFDGIEWERVSKPCFKSRYEEESFGRPWVIKDGSVYKMWYSVRGMKGYRDKGGQHYMIGYAESNNGENFKREPIDITTSDSGWDSDMVEYASVFKYQDDYYMLYNGNQFGKTGFGYAIKKH